MLARHISRTRTVAQVMSLSHHPHFHVHVSVSHRLVLPIYFPHFLPHSFHFLLHLKIVDYNLLRTPHKESMDLSDEFLLSTGYEPNAYDFKETSVVPYTELLDSPPIFSDKVSSADADYDDAALEVCFAKLTEHIAITHHEKTCLSVCRRRQCPTERGDPLSKETRKHRLGLCSTNKKSKFLQSAKQELTDTNFKPLTTEEVY